ncbi:MAG: signal peptidase II, partial [Coriobacteriia bacterium]|nr:signal peptidase II [Coriobacteriia bacterium]
GPVAFIPGFLDFHLVYNQGAAWGIFTGARSYFVVVAVVSLVLVAGYLLLRRKHPPLVALALGLFAGGTLGNGFDRLMHGQVVDFLHPLFVDFPVFNVADSGLTVGVILLIIAIWVAESRPAAKSATSDGGAPVDDAPPGHGAI